MTIPIGVDCHRLYPYLNNVSSFWGLLVSHDLVLQHLSDQISICTSAKIGFRVRQL